MYAVYHGPEGLRGLAARIHGHARTFTKSMELLQLKVSHYLYFDTVKIQTPKAKLLVEAAMKEGINLYWDGSDAIQVSFDETHEAKDIVALVALMARVLGVDGTKALAALHGQNLQNFSDWPKTMLREGDKLLPYEAFRSYHTETKMMRYINWLERKDLTLTQAMIPLGSCTMKLNAGTELTPVTWPAFADVHPHAPKSQTLGYQTMIRELSEDLAEITGFHAVSLQPNAGSQGEYAGLLVVRRMFESIGQNHRDICLIPQSAHGTNPASAVMAGLEVVIVKCDQNGNVDTVDLTQKAEKYRDRLCALMVTYPSTHGVFEESIKDICQTIHRNGGRVYLDGANMNALVGLCRPGDFGADVCHLNLHKTFAIPHGGGGPGVGPIGVTKELSPFLPAHVWDPSLSSENAIGAVAAAPYGSAGVLPISWSYIKMMGSSGLKLASEIAILNANYVAKRLEQAYPVLYKGKQGFVAHECILDLRGFKKSAGIEPDDVAKRLMDYGFHAPTMSWPVPGTLMIEPTESESLDELDRFCEAMLKIRQEIAQIENGTWPKDNNPLSHAPHTAQLVSSTEWTRPYTREVAAYPADGLRTNKYWPTVARVDGPYGDRNFVCSCPSLSSYE
jgi:glycine dehydrogenase